MKKPLFNSTGNYKAHALVCLLTTLIATGTLLPTYQAQALGAWKYVWSAVTGVASLIGGVWTISEVVNGPGDILGKVNARTTLIDPAVTIEAAHAYDGSTMGAGPHGYTSTRGEYEYHDYTFAFVNWDPATQEYVLGNQMRASGASFLSQSDFESRNSATRETIWWQEQFTGPGAWIVTGVSRRYTCGSHTIQSTISGDWFSSPDGQLATAAAALNFSFPVKLHYSRKQMKWDTTNHQWKTAVWQNLTITESGVSAISRSQWTTDIVESNTQVSSERVRGGSNIYWSENQYHTTARVPLEYYDDQGLPTGQTRLIEVPKIIKTYTPRQSLEQT